MRLAEVLLRLRVDPELELVRQAQVVPDAPDEHVELTERPQRVLQGSPVQLQTQVCRFTSLFCAIVHARL